MNMNNLTGLIIRPPSLTSDMRMSSSSSSRNSRTSSTSSSVDDRLSPYSAGNSTIKDPEHTLINDMQYEIDKLCLLDERISRNTSESSSIFEDLPMCDEHQLCKDYFCYDCAIEVCVDCIKADHTEHYLYPGMSCKELFEETERVRETIRDNIMHIENQISRLELKRVTQGQNIKSFFNRYREIVDTREADLLQDLTYITECRVRILDQKLKENQTIMRCNQALMEKLQTYMNNGNYSAASQEGRYAKKHLEVMRNATRNMPPTPEEDILFVPAENPISTALKDIAMISCTSSVASVTLRTNSNNALAMISDVNINSTSFFSDGSPFNPYQYPATSSLSPLSFSTAAPKMITSPLDGPIIQPLVDLLNTASALDTPSNAFGSIGNSSSLVNANGFGSNDFAARNTFRDTNTFGGASGFGSSSGFGSPGSLGLTNSFGSSASNGFGSNSSNGFGSNSSNGFGNANSNGFGNTTPNGFGNTTPNGFGNAGRSGFGNTSPNGFGNNTRNGFGNTSPRRFDKNNGGGFNGANNRFGNSNNGYNQNNANGYNRYNRHNSNGYNRNNSYNRNHSNNFNANRPNNFNANQNGFNGANGFANSNDHANKNGFGDRNSNSVATSNALVPVVTSTASVFDNITRFTLPSTSDNKADTETPQYNTTLFPPSTSAASLPSTPVEITFPPSSELVPYKKPIIEHPPSSPGGSQTSDAGNFPVEFHTSRAYGRVRKPVIVFGKEGSGDYELCRPWGVCCDKNGHIIIADRSNNRIQIFRTDGSHVRKFGRQGSEDGEFNRPAGVAIDYYGRIVVTDKDNHRVQVFTMDGKFVFSFGERGQGNGKFHYPWDVDVSSSGMIAITDTRNHRIQLFSGNGTFVKKFGFENMSNMWKYFDSPRGLCFTPEETVVVTDFNNHRLYEVDFDKTPKLVSSDTYKKCELFRPQGLAMDPDGNVLVSDCRNNRIQVFDRKGDLIGSFGVAGKDPGQFDRPSGIALTPEGKIVVVDFGNHRIQIF